MYGSASEGPTSLPIVTKKSVNKIPYLVIIAFLLIINAVLLFALIQKDNSSKGGSEVVPTLLQPEISETVIPSQTVSPEASPTSQPIVTSSATAAAKVLSKVYTETVLPWVYTIKYPSDWNIDESIKDNNKLTKVFAKKIGQCAQEEALCSVVLSVGYPAEMVDSSYSTELKSETVVLENEGEKELKTYKYNSSGAHYIFIDIRNGWIMANITPGKDSEASILFKQILNTYSSDESPDAM